MRSSLAFVLAAAFAGSAGAVPISHYVAIPLDHGDTVATVASLRAVDAVAGIHQRSIFAGDSDAFIDGPGGAGHRLPVIAGSDLGWDSLYGLDDTGRVYGSLASPTGAPGGGFYRTQPNGRAPLEAVTFPAVPFSVGPGGALLGYVDIELPELRRRAAVPLTTGPEYIRRCIFAAGAGQPAVDIGAIAGDQAICEPRAVNASGRVTGLSGTRPGGTPDIVEQAFLTGPGGVGVVGLGSLTPGQYSGGTAVNERGVVVGWSQDDDFHTSRAFITDVDGANMRDLGTLGGSSSQAMGVNDDGNVVGVADDASRRSRPFVTGDNGVGMVDLQSITDGLPEYLDVTSIAINDLGHIVLTDLGQHAWVLCERRGCR